MPAAQLCGRAVAGAVTVLFQRLGIQTLAEEPSQVCFTAKALEGNKGRADQSQQTAGNWAADLGGFWGEVGPGASQTLPLWLPKSSLSTGYKGLQMSPCAVTSGTSRESPWPYNQSIRGVSGVSKISHTPSSNPAAG